MAAHSQVKYTVPSIDEFESHVSGLFPPISNEERVVWNVNSRPVTLSGFLANVESSGLKNALSVPPEVVYQNVYLIDKSMRTAPTTYLTNDYISQQTDLFAGRAARVDNAATFDRFYAVNIKVGLPIGRSDGVLMSPRSLIDDAFVPGNPTVMEQPLGMPAGTYAAQAGMVRTYVNNPLDYGLRLPTGIESGANPYWVPGGVTFNTKGGAGLPEMLINPIRPPPVDPKVIILRGDVDE